MLLALLALAAPWTPPIGIPAPKFGINETAGPANCWVDNTNQNARDHDFGSPSQPRFTIPDNLPPGSVVEVRGGPYSYGSPGYIPITAQGTAQAPVIIRGVGKPRFSQKLAVFPDGGPANTYLILEGLDLFRLEIIAPGHHIAVRDCEVHGNATSGGIVLASYSTATLSDIVIVRNEVHHNGDWQSAGDQDIHGIEVGAFCSRVWVLDNVLHHNSGDGVQVNAGRLDRQAGTHHIYVGRNVAYENKQTGFWTKQAIDVIFSQNTSHSHRPIGASPSAWGAGMGYQYGPERVWFLFNRIHDCAYGIQATSTSGAGTGKDSYFVGNVIERIRHSPAYHYEPGSCWSNAGIMLVGTPNRWVVDNTIRDCDGGIYSPSAGSMVVEGNVVERSGRPLFIEQAVVAQRCNSFDAAPVRTDCTSEVYAKFKTIYGLSIAPAALVGDVDADGDVDLRDMALLLQNAGGPK